MIEVNYIDITRTRYEKAGFTPYRWLREETPPPWCALPKPLSQCRIGMVASAGVYVAGQIAFHYRDDTSIRAIPKDVATADLRFAHVTDHYLGGAREDPNCLFPIDALRRLAAEGVIGGLADTLFSCMGGIYSHRKAREILAPALAEALAAQHVDAVLLVPFCPVCHQTLSLVARHLEGAGLPTTLVGVAADIVRSVNPPRATLVDFPLGHSAGRPHDPDGQRAIIRAALGALETMTAPGATQTVDQQWGDGIAWKRAVIEEDLGDRRPPRDETPRYERESDRLLAEGERAG